MGLFTKDTTKDALKLIEKINQEMRAISASVHLNYNMIDGRNRSKVKSHYNIIAYHIHKYERIKNNLSIYENVELNASIVTVWNGERVGVPTWELYLSNTMRQLKIDLDY